MAIDFADLRRKMVDSQIRTVDVTRLTLLEAFLTVPREDFVPATRKNLAYLDQDVLLSAELGQPARYMMAPAPLAKLMQLADIGVEDIVLDVGATTGYCAALLSQLAHTVYALESNDDLADQARVNLARCGCSNVSVVSGPLERGYALEGRFSIILMEGSVDRVPQVFLQQLREGGRLVVVEGRGNAGIAKLYTRRNGVTSPRRTFNLAIKPLQGFLKAPEFTFNQEQAEFC